MLLTTSCPLLILVLALFLAACGGGSGTRADMAGPAVDADPAQPAEVSNGTPVGVISRTLGGCAISQATGGLPDRGFTITAMNWLQSVQQDASSADTRLAGGKMLRLRVDVTAPRADYAAPTDNVLQISFANGSCKSYALTMKDATLPKTVNRNTLDSSLVAVIPAADVSEAMTAWQLAINQRRETVASATDSLYRTGSMAVQPTLSDLIVYQPIVFQGMTGHTPGKDSMDSVLKRIWPQAVITSTVEAAWAPTDLTPGNAVSVRTWGSKTIYTFSGGILRKVLSELDHQCYGRGGFDHVAHAVRCISAWPDNVIFEDPGFAYAGIAATQGAMFASFSATDSSNALSAGALVFTHEFGHQMGLGHANCGSPSQVDADLYADGGLGEAGAAFDEATGRYFAATSGTHDVMSYCHGNAWSSDKGFRKVIAYKLAPASTACTSCGSSAHGAPAQDQPVIRFDLVRGIWQASNTVAPANLAASTLMPDAGAISPLLRGLKTHVLDTDAGQLENGPYYLRDTAALRKMLKSGLLPVLPALR